MRRVRSHVIGADGTLGEVQEPRHAMRAELVGPGHRSLRVKPPWQREPLRYEAEDRRVVIEVEATEAETRGGFTLKVWDADGTRTIILTGVTFP